MPEALQFGEQTGAQKVPGVLSSIVLLGELSQLKPELPANFQTYRRMRRDPTISLALTIGMAPILAAEWTIETTDDAPEDAEDLINDCLIEQREPFLDAALRGCFSFGWQPFEKIFEAEEGQIILKKLKPLLQDITEIIVTKETGAFAGFKQQGKEKPLPLANSLLLNYRVEGTDWYGQGLLEDARAVWNEWVEANAGAARYDKRIAGANIVLHYEQGQTPDESGSMQNNDVNAKRILLAFQSSGAVAIPTDLQKFTDVYTKTGKPIYAWEFEILGDSTSRQPAFIERLAYLDKLKVRAMLLPERSILEGQYGTKAEAAEHINLAFTNAELIHRHLTRLLNWHAVDQLLALNWGEETRGTVKLVAMPIVDTKLQMLKDIYQAILSNPMGYLDEKGLIDTAGIRDALGIPTQEETTEGTEPIPAGMDESNPNAGMLREMYKDTGQKKEAQQASLSAEGHWVTHQGKHIFIEEGSEVGGAGPGKAQGKESEGKESGISEKASSGLQSAVKEQGLMSREARRKFREARTEIFESEDMPDEVRKSGIDVHNAIYADGWTMDTASEGAGALRTLSGGKILYHERIGYGDDDPEKLASLKTWGEGTAKSIAKQYGVSEETMKKVVDIDRQLTQAALKAHFPESDTVEVYRGIGKTHLDAQGAAFRGGQKARVELDALSSWTSDRAIASAFAKQGGGVVLKMAIPKADVFTCSLSLENQHESEFVVKGGIREVEVL